MSKDDLIDMQGTVVAVHSGGLYRVQCDAGHEVLAQLSGQAIGSPSAFHHTIRSAASLRSGHASQNH